MSERDFLYWLQGYLEMSDAKTLDERQVQIIKDHIKLVVKKVTPYYGGITTTGPITFPYPPSISTKVIC